MCIEHLLGASSVKTAKEIVRAMGLLGVADNVKYALDFIYHYAANARFRRENKDLKLPPAYLCHDAYNTTNLEYYYKSGSEHARYISKLIGQHTQASNGELRVLDFGCGPCRLLRHLEEFLPGAIVCGSDYNRKSIQWAADNLNGANFSTNELMPPTAYKNDEFDVIYLISVVTHLSDDASRAWFSEFYRVLKPGGILIFTTNSENTYESLSEREKAIYNSGKPVIKARVAEGKKQYLQYGGDAYYSAFAGRRFEEILKDVHPYESGSSFLNDNFSQTVRVYKKQG